MKTSGRSCARIAPWRRRLQWLVTLLLLLVPFLSAGGNPLLRLDAGSRTLFLFGAAIRIEEFYLLLLAVLILVFAFLSVTMLFGRVWCGWFCPQTTLADLADWLDRQIGRLIPPAAAPVCRQLAYLALSALVAGNLVCYFLAPRELLLRLQAGSPGTVAGVSLAAVFLLVYLDLALVRRSFCRTVCPYGRIQLLTMETGTLTLEFDPERRGDCLRCGACVRACPMGIDVRDGLQIECINCGRCLDACRDVMERRGDRGLIAYRFGQGGFPQGMPLNVKTLLLGVVTLLLCVLFAVGIATRQEATLKVQRAANGEVKRLADGSLVNFYALYLENRGTKPARYRLKLSGLSGHRVELVGTAAEFVVGANGNRKVFLALKVSPAPATPCSVEIALIEDGREVAAAKLPLLLH